MLVGVSVDEYDENERLVLTGFEKKRD